MADINQPITNEMIIAQIGEIARSTNQDSFRVRISRKDNAQQLLPKVIATLQGATSDHFASPETWLSQLAGGGHYFLQVSHPTNPTKPFAPIQVVMTGELRPPDAYADTKPTWRGPAEIVMPEKVKGAEQDSASGPLYVGGLGAESSSPRNGVLQGSAPNPSAPAPGDANAFERFQLQQERNDIARRERAAAEERHRQELDLTKRANELELAKLRAEIAASAAAAKPVGDDPLVKMLTIMREEAKLARELEESRRREEREREDRRLEAERQREERRAERDREDRKEREAAQQRIEERLAAERKASDDRMMQILSEKQNATKEMMEMMSPLTEVMGQTMNLVVQSMHAMQELAPQSESEPPVIKLLSKALDGFQAAAAAGRMKVRRPPPNRPPLPPSRPAPGPAPQPAPSNGAAAPQSFAGVPSQPREPAMDRLLKLIHAHTDPMKVARFFYANINDPSIAQPLQQNGMSIVPTFAPFLLDWLKADDANQEYMRRVFTAVQELGMKSGLVDAAPQDTGVEVDGEEEEEEEADEPEGQDGDGEEVEPEEAE